MGALMARLIDRIGPVRFINILAWLSGKKKIKVFFCFVFFLSLNSLQRRGHTTKHHQIKEFVLKASEPR